MRILKTLGLAAIAALAAMAFVGAGTASADTLCENATIPDTGECPVVNRVTLPAKIAGLAVGAKLLNASGDTLLTCNSETLGEATTNNGPHTSLVGTITKLLFTGCVGSCTKAHGINFPYKSTAIALTLHVLFEKGTGAAGKPGAKIEGCPFGVICTYEIKNNQALLKVVGDTLVADKIPLTLLNPGICSFLAPEGFWDASYLMTLDPKAAEHIVPVYLVSLP